ncbi:MAG: hypothetical protein ACE15C_17620 [Phycisphaerae bacterium]
MRIAAIPGFLLIFALLAVTPAAPAAKSGAAATQPSPEGAKETYKEFNDFCIANFGVAKEPLTTKLPGDKLKVLEGGDWMHVSETSACIAWETSLPAKTYVEYGPTAEYGSKTPEPERFFYLHVHYVKGLKADTTYHYRLVSVDEKGTKVAGDDKTFTTKKVAGAIYLPGDMGKPPYDLKKPGTYIVTEDIVSPSTCINILAKDVVLDLNGHTLTYDNEHGVRDPNPNGMGYFAAQGEHGIRGSYAQQKTGKILNGIIVQGPGADGGTVGGAYEPVAAGGEEMAGITAYYYGSSCSGLASGAKDLHHNVIVDQGEIVVNRHQGVDAIPAGSPKVHHNLVKRCRQRGFFIASGAEVYNNEIYVDSWATNSYDIMCYKTKKADVHHNRCFGTGYHTIGIGTVSGSEDIKVHDNFIHHAAVGTEGRWTEYGDMAGVNAIRITWGGKDFLYENNVMVVTGKGKSSVRGLWVCPEPGITGVVFRKNTIKAFSEDEKMNSRGAICVCGESKLDDAPMLYEDNTVLSNFCNVVLGDSYGVGCNSRFVNNTFIRLGERADYRTIQCGYWILDSVGHIFLDSKFEGGAGYDKVKFNGGMVKLSESDAKKYPDAKGNRDFTVEWTISLVTAAGAKVTAKDKDGKEVFSGTADKDGKLDIPLAQCKYDAPGGLPEGQFKKVELTPHTIIVEKDGKTASKTVTADKKQQVEIPIK